MCSLIGFKPSPGFAVAFHAFRFRFSDRIRGRHTDMMPTRSPSSLGATLSAGIVVGANLPIRISSSVTGLRLMVTLWVNNPFGSVNR
jgi:hypothetical protein